MYGPLRTDSPDVLPTADAVLAKCDFFVRCGFWSGPSSPQHSDWLSNFPSGDKDLAAALLNSFQYLNEAMCRRLFIAAFAMLAQHETRDTRDHASARDAWADFCQSLFVAHVPGETPRSTDSGYAYARLARQVLGIDERTIISPNDALQHSLTGRPLIFVDDFLGSGEQFLTMWRNGTALALSFAQVSSGIRLGKVFYCPLIATKHGADRVRNECGVTVLAGHELDPGYNILDPESRCWPAQYRHQGQELVRRLAKERGFDPCGFHGFSLALAFHNSVPDATAPLFRYAGPSWTPLIQRT